MNPVLASSCYQSNPVFTSQIPNPIAPPLYSQINYSNFTHKLFLELLGKLSLNMPSTLELSRHAGFSLCHFSEFVYRLFVISLLECISFHILRDKWRDQVWGESLSLSCFWPPLSISVILSLHFAWALFMLCGVAVTSSETQARGGKSFRLHLGSNSPSILARVWPED